MISEVDLEELNDLRVVVVEGSGAIILHLGQENFLSRYLVYLGHIAEWKQKFPEIQSVDLRYERQVVINGDAKTEAQRTPGTPATPGAKSQVKQGARRNAPAKVR